MGKTTGKRETTITEGKKAEEKLKYLKEFNSAILASIEDPISVIDVNDFKIAGCNNAFLEKHELNQEEVIGKICYKLIHHRSGPCLPPDHVCPLANTVRTGMSSRAEHVHYKENGEKIYVEVNTYPIEDENKKVIQVVHISRDITERKKAGEALRVQALLLQNIVEGVNMVNSEGIITFTNLRFDEMFGYEKGELIGKHVSDLNNLEPEENDRLVGEIIEQMEREGYYSGEFESVKKDGTSFYSYASVSVLELPNETLWISVQEDITERKKAEEELKKFKFISDRSNDAHFLVDKEGRFKYVNKVACEKMDYSEKELLNLSVLDVDIAYDKAKYQALFNRIQKERIPPFDTACKRKDGSNFPGEISATGIKLYGKQYIFGVLRDITERKKVEEDIRSSERRYRELFDHMSSGVAVYEAKDNGNDFIFKDFNKAGEQIDGVKKEDLIGKSVVKVFPGVKEFGLFDVFRRVWKGGKPEHHPISLYEDQRITGWRENYIYKLLSGEIVAVYDDITERKQAEDIKQKHQEALEQKNIALREMMEQIKLERVRLEENVAANVNEALIPILKELKTKDIPSTQINLLEHEIDKLTSSFSVNIKIRSSKLTIREVEICHMIESGMASKEIANFLRISPQTVVKHRKNIRKKLRITDKNIGLTTFLRELQEKT